MFSGAFATRASCAFAVCIESEVGTVSPTSLHKTNGGLFTPLEGDV